MSTADFDRRLNDWFDAVEPQQVPVHVLPNVFSRVRHTGQLRGPLHRYAAAIESAWTPRLWVTPGLALVILTALLIVALAAVALAAGVIRLPSKPSVVDGLIAVQGEIGPEPYSYRIRLIDSQTGEDAFVTPSSVRSCGAKFSPDGSQYAFLYQNADQIAASEVFVAVAPAAGEFQPRLLVRKAAQAYFDPAWAPDGSAVVMTMEGAGEDGYHRDLWVLPADGTPGTRLTEVLTSFSADWSADGAWIAFVGEGPVHELFIIRPDGSDLRMLRSSGVDSVAWSPVREELAYSASDGKLQVISLDGTELFAMDDGRDPASDSTSAGSHVPKWSDDGTKIALTPDGVLKIFDVAAATVETISLPEPVARATWSATGRTLAVVTVHPAEEQIPDADGNVTAMPRTGDLLEVSIDGSPPRLIAEHVQGSCMSSGAALSWQELRR